jgi:hypothetical protein
MKVFQVALDLYCHGSSMAGVVRPVEGKSESRFDSMKNNTVKQSVETVNLIELYPYGVEFSETILLYQYCNRTLF